MQKEIRKTKRNTANGIEEMKKNLKAISEKFWQNTKNKNIAMMYRIKESRITETVKRAAPHCKVLCIQLKQVTCVLQHCAERCSDAANGYLQKNKI